jgi:hypothetical protein
MVELASFVLQEEWGRAWVAVKPERGPGALLLLCRHMGLAWFPVGNPVRVGVSGTVIRGNNILWLELSVRSVFSGSDAYVYISITPTEQCVLSFLDELL